MRNRRNESSHEVKYIDISGPMVFLAVVCTVAIMGWLYPGLVEKMQTKYESEQASYEAPVIEEERGGTNLLPDEEGEGTEVETPEKEEELQSGFTVDDFYNLRPENQSKLEVSLHRMASKGKPDAKYMLAKFYEIAKENSNKSFIWMNRAAMAGDAGAMGELATLYETGNGTRPSRYKAYAWLTIAEAYGNKSAAGRRASLVQLISEDEIMRGHSTAESLFKRIRP